MKTPPLVARVRRRLLPLLLLLALTDGAFAQRLSPLAKPPNWQELDAFQKTITRAEFLWLLENVYAPGDAARPFITVSPDAATIRISLNPPAEWKLEFAPDATSAVKPRRFWRAASELGPAPVERPLQGVRIALDPGHLGGAWAKMEERWFQLGESKPVEEGEMTLRVAKLLAPQLTALGAEVSFVRDAPGPTTPDRPATLQEAARAELTAQGVAVPAATYDAEKVDDPTRGQTVQWQSEILFYRISEIRHRAAVVNEKLKPDVVVCLHFNAEDWGGDVKNPAFVPRNHFHALVNGNYAAGELRFDDQRHDLLCKLLERSYAEELAISERVAGSVAFATQLPPYLYTTPNAIRTGASPYLWARNLLANRLYRAPVVFLEPYVMNNETTWERVQLGDYEGERFIAGASRKSIYREYADSVAAGLASYYRDVRPR